MRRKVFICPAEGYLARSLGPALQVELIPRLRLRLQNAYETFALTRTCLQAQGFEVLGGHDDPTPPEYLSASFQTSNTSAAASATRQFLAIADVVIYTLFGHEQAARDAVVHMAKQPVSAALQPHLGKSEGTWSCRNKHNSMTVRYPLVCTSYL
jgi:hypothetical protein